ncbi:Aspartic peptidase [Artemisia annua]|uniref:Aspartic peptidase n=1 Tax=Artemisia annua TaxID=35608 RepID=A0A2U1Q2Z9_ARTAN|nr:Aspartic peptidase [Artemisia annua]
MSIIPSLLITSLFISSLTCTSNPDHDHFNGAVFNVMSKFNGRKKAVLLSDLKAHDSIRHFHVLAVDIGLGGIGRPNAVGLYYAKIGIGTPPRDYYVQVDTGSDIMWINCAHCQTCLKKGYHGLDLTLYNPNESLTSARVTCDQKFCADINRGTVGGCRPNVSCMFTEYYKDGSGSLGYFIRDVVQYDSVSGDLETKLANGSVIFGCGASQSGNLLNSEDALDGIIGFGKSNASVISQLASYGKVKKMFAHCLDGENGGGIFAIGHVVQPKVNSTRLIQDQSAYYSVNMTGIKVGTEFLNLTTDSYGKTKKAKTVIDSGTTLAYLPEVIYKPLVKKIVAGHSGMRLRLLQDQYTCFEYSGSVDDGFPAVTFYFENSLFLKVYPRDYLFPLDEFLCFGWQNNGRDSLSSEDRIILGDLVLSNKLVLYDLENQTIGWTEYNCSSSIALKDEITGVVHLVGSHMISSACNLIIHKDIIFLLLIVLMNLTNL